MALGCEANVTQSGSRDGNAEYLVKAMRAKMSIESPQYLVRLVARALEQVASVTSDIKESLADAAVLADISVTTDDANTSHVLSSTEVEMAAADSVGEEAYDDSAAPAWYKPDLEGRALVHQLMKVHQEISEADDTIDESFVSGARRLDIGNVVYHAAVDLTDSEEVP